MKNEVGMVLEIYSVARVRFKGELYSYKLVDTTYHEIRIDKANLWSKFWKLRNLNCSVKKKKKEQNKTFSQATYVLIGLIIE